ncbi:MAG: nucleotide exchange factor GrpE [Candidatus Omnitrophica bacterium]|nr:nucleotide exchange factor GrpE [Candidatus Omnitrophota bacterium]MDD5518759.1 nucleotide exchange factor GrpE [Candidatus Omnitrophota bacterium]
MSEHKENNKEEKIVSLKESEYLKLKEDADKVKEFSDKALRLQADFENTRKRLEKEKQDFVKFANEGIILELLNVLDDLGRSVSLAETHKEDLTAFLKGVEMILAHLYEMLKEYGLKPIEAEGKIFDPHYHEALLQIEDKDLPEHTIVEELQKGYLLNERVIRTAKVKVSKKTGG